MKDFISNGGMNVPSRVKTDNDPSKISVGNELPQFEDMSSGKKDWDRDGDRQPAAQSKRVDIAPKQNLNP